MSLYYHGNIAEGLSQPAPNGLDVDGEAGFREAVGVAQGGCGIRWPKISPVLLGGGDGVGVGFFYSEDVEPFPSFRGGYAEREKAPAGAVEAGVGGKIEDPEGRSGLQVTRPGGLFLACYSVAVRTFPNVNARSSAPVQPLTRLCQMLLKFGILSRSSGDLFSLLLIVLRHLDGGA